MKFLGRVWTCVFAAAIVARLPAEGASRVQLRRGGYEDVVIAISPEVQESPELISAIKSKVKVASELLFAASRSTVFFRKVTLLLPKKWTNVAADSVANDISYEDSDIRVAPAHPAYADQPFTLQPGGCGSPGMFSHFTSKLFTDTNLSDVWGPPERLLVLEWAKLRWGVFEELGYRDDPIYPLFYRPDLDAEDDGTDEVEDDEGGDNVGGEKSSVEEEEGEEGEVSMAGDVKGEKDKAKEKRTKFVANLCAPGSLEGRYVIPEKEEECSSPSTECDFLVKDFRPNLWPVSLTRRRRRNLTVAFCDDEEDSDWPHNQLSPNKHNLRCAGASWWAVMRRHQDFSGGPADHEETSFTVVQPKDAHVTLVLDMTQSSTRNRTLGFARLWISDYAPSGCHLAIICVVEGAKMGQSPGRAVEMTRLTPSSRISIMEDLEKRVDSEGDAKTIYEGLRMASERLENMNSSGTAFVILVCSSAVEDKDLDDIRSSWDKPTFVLSMSPQEKTDLQKFVEDTKGNILSLNGSMDDDALREVASNVTAYISQPRVPPKEAPITLQNETVSGRSRGANVTFDGTAGTLVFRLSTNSSAHVKEAPVVIDPLGTRHQAKRFSVLSSHSWMVVVENAGENSAGQWTLELNTTEAADSYVRMETVLEPDPHQGPLVQVVSWIATTSGTAAVNGSRDDVLLYASLTEGDAPVVGADVEAVVVNVANDSVWESVRLLDSGSGADAMANDGIYSRYFTQFAIGNFSVDIKVSVNSRAKDHRPPVSDSGAPSHPRVCCGSVFPTIPLTRPVLNLNRISHAGTFTITDNPIEDRTRPSPITDLRVKEVAWKGLYDEVRVRLSWTATGDDRDNGRASKYTVRASPNRRHMEGETCVGKCSTLTPEMDASPPPPPAGERVTASVLLPSHAHFFLTVIAQDDGGNDSPPSNVVAVDTRGLLLASWAPWLRQVLWALLCVVIAGVTLPLFLACNLRHFNGHRLNISLITENGNLV